MSERSCGSAACNCEERLIRTMAQTSRCDETVGNWGSEFEWEIKGAGVEEVWAVMGDFAGVEKWVPKLVQTCDIVEGEPQKAGCIRKVELLAAEARETPCSVVFEKLLFLDNLSHHMSYSIVAGTTTPGLCLLVDSYVATFKLSPLCQLDEEGSQCAKGTLLQWSYVCRPVSTLSPELTHDMLLSLYRAAVTGLEEGLSCVAQLISKASLS